MKKLADLRNAPAQTINEMRKIQAQGASPWAIRDIKHGKTFHFASYEEMAAWIKKAQDQMT